jgi:hypothetical protein
MLFYKKNEKPNQWSESNNQVIISHSLSVDINPAISAKKNNNKKHFLFSTYDTVNIV